MPAEPQSPVDLHQQLAELQQEQRQLVEGLRQGQAYFQQLGRSVWRVQEEERRHLARELHDGVGPNLTAMIHLIASSLATLPQAPENVALRDLLDRAHAIGESTLRDTREMSRLLRPQILDDLGLEQAFRWLVRTYHENHALDIVLEFTEPTLILDNDRSILVFRVAQEALTNIVRHAKASRVQIAFQASASHATLLVVDDGLGCDVDVALAAGSSGAGSGLGGMRDRMRLFGGTLRASSTPGCGFRIEVVLPLQDVTSRAQP
jgi:signal transduction histidine kinase